MTDKYPNEYPGDPFYNSIDHITREEYWNKVIASGWCEDLDTEYVEKLKQQVFDAFARDREMVQVALAVTSVEFNDFGNSYADLLKELQASSFGIFHPEQNIEITEDPGTDLVDAGGEKYTYLSFVHNSKKHELWLYPGRIADTNVFWLVNRALYGRDARMYTPLPKGLYQDDIVEICFTTKAAMQKGYELGLFPWEDTHDFFEVFVTYDDYTKQQILTGRL